MNRYIRTTIFAIAIGLFLNPLIALPSAKAEQKPPVSILEQIERETITLVERVLPSVVTIRVLGEAGEVPSEDNEGAEPSEPEERGPSGSGSGFFVSADGLIVTNDHVVSLVTSMIIKEVIVVLPNNVEITGTVIGTDRETDIALIKIDVADIPPSKRAFKPLSWGDSAKLRQGATVIAIGSPFGLSNTVTKGIVSTTDRYYGSPYVPAIQHDAAVNKGNSGGPLFNIYGEVVGINSAIFSPSGSNAGIAFAIPSNTAQRIVEQLTMFGEVKRGFIGAQVRDVTLKIAEKLKPPATKGVHVPGVTNGMPAHRAGMKKDDIVISWGGIAVRDTNHFLQLVGRSEIGKPVSVEVWRNNSVVTLSITPMERAEEKTFDLDSLFPPEFFPKKEEKK